MSLYAIYQLYLKSITNCPLNVEAFSYIGKSGPPSLGIMWSASPTIKHVPSNIDDYWRLLRYKTQIQTNFIHFICHATQYISYSQKSITNCPLNFYISGSSDASPNVCRLGTATLHSPLTLQTNNCQSRFINKSQIWTNSIHFICHATQYISYSKKSITNCPLNVQAKLATRPRPTT